MEIQNHFTEGEFVSDDRVGWSGEVQLFLDPSPFDAQRDDCSNVVGRHVNAHFDDRFCNVVKFARRGELGGVVYPDDFAALVVGEVDHAGRCCNQIQIVFAFKSLLDDFHVQQAQKSATKTKTERFGRVRLKAEGRVIEMELG